MPVRHAQPPAEVERFFREGHDALLPAVDHLAVAHVRAMVEAGESAALERPSPRLRARDRFALRWARVTAAGVCVAVSGTTGLAYAGELPAPVRHAVDAAVQPLGLELPRPAPARPGGGGDGPATTVERRAGAPHGSRGTHGSQRKAGRPATHAAGRHTGSGSGSAPPATSESPAGPPRHGNGNGRAHGKGQGQGQGNGKGAGAANGRSNPGKKDHNPGKGHDRQPGGDGAANGKAHADGNGKAADPGRGNGNGNGNDSTPGKSDHGAPPGRGHAQAARDAAPLSDAD